MSYPNPTPPSSIPTDVGHPLVVVHNTTNGGSLPFTGTDIVELVLIGVLAIIIGAMVLYTIRNKNAQEA